MRTRGARDTKAQVRDTKAEARHDAVRMQQRYGVRSPADIRVEAWAHDHGIEIIEADLDGASAQLIRVGDVVQIVLPMRVIKTCVRRFSLAHELYHFLKKHPSLTPTMMCIPKALRRRDEDLRLHEVGSNAFAGAVLLPEFLLRKRCEVSPVTLDVPVSIAKEYDVSLLASAIRFVELSSERCAAVLSCRGQVEWAAASATFSKPITRGKRLKRASVAWEYHATGKLDEREQLVPASAWLDTTANVDIFEHSTCSPEHGTVLSLLWAPEQVGPQLGMR